MLSSLQEEVLACKKCPLARTRTKVVFGDGNDSAEVMFIGEAPGYYEDQQGKPFVGAAGQLLDKLLSSIGFGREDVYIANVLKCRPPQNRDPASEEIETCKPFLLKQIEIIKPKVLCTLGNFATRLIMNKSVNISRVHGQKFTDQGFVIFPIFHPAAALHATTNLSALEFDFQRLKTVLEEGVEIEPHPEQMGLF